MKKLFFRHPDYYGSKNGIIGKGTYGDVYRYVQPGKSVAVKKFMDGVAGNIFLEIFILTNYHHPHLIQLIDVSLYPEKTYIVMEMADHCLKDLVLQKLTHKQIMKYTYGITNALAFLHEHHIWHCDLKPHNIVVKDGQAKLIDFGLAVINGNQMGGHVQSLLWRSPELLVDYQYKFDSSVDIWSLGITVCNMIFGEFTFIDGTDEKECLIDIIEKVGGFDETSWPDFIPNMSLWGRFPSPFRKTVVGIAKKYPNGSIDLDFHSLKKPMPPFLLCFVKKILIANPEKRPSAKQILDLPEMDLYLKHKYYAAKQIYQMPKAIKWKDITIEMITILMHWLILVQTKEKMCEQNVTVCYWEIIDYLNRHPNTSRKKLQLLGMVVFHCVVFLHDYHDIEESKMVYYSDNAYTVEEFRLFKIKFLKESGFCFNYPPVKRMVEVSDSKKRMAKKIMKVLNLLTLRGAIYSKYFLRDIIKEVVAMMKRENPVCVDIRNDILKIRFWIQENDSKFKFRINLPVIFPSR